jgi:hypothetical protein
MSYKLPKKQKNIVSLKNNETTKQVQEQIKSFLIERGCSLVPDNTITCSVSYSVDQVKNASVIEELKQMFQKMIIGISPYL